MHPRRHARKDSTLPPPLARLPPRDLPPPQAALGATWRRHLCKGLLLVRALLPTQGRGLPARWARAEYPAPLHPARPRGQRREGTCPPDAGQPPVTIANLPRPSLPRPAPHAPPSLHLCTHPPSHIRHHTSTFAHSTTSTQSCRLNPADSIPQLSPSRSTHPHAPPHACRSSSLPTALSSRSPTAPTDALVRRLCWAVAASRP